MNTNSTFKGAGARSLADYVLRQIDPMIARRGFGEGSLLMAWREIVGDQLAAICAPDQMKWPKIPVHYACYNRPNKCAFGVDMC